MQFRVKLLATRLIPQTRRNVPEADVCALGLLNDHLEVFALSNHFRQIFGGLEYAINVSLQTVGALGTPHEPELENVRPTTALDVLVARIEPGVVEFVLLEQVGGVAGVALPQDVRVACEERGALLWCRQ